MLIRYGYEITLTCQQPTALVCLLSVHEDRAPDISVPEATFTNPDVAVSTYRDLFGNRCRRLVAPAGDLTMWGDAHEVECIGEGNGTAAIALARGSPKRLHLIN